MRWKLPTKMYWRYAPLFAMNELAGQKKHYRAVIVSPHLDDAVFSCGGRIAQMVREGPVLVLNIFTRYLAEVKVRGVVLGNERYLEEAAAAQFLGFESRNLGELDVSFRRDPYRKLGNIFRPPIQADLAWLPTLREKVFAELDALGAEEIYIPLGIGWHVDHVLTHLLFEAWKNTTQLVYYEDAPYCCIPHSTRYRLNEIASYSWQPDDDSLAPINETRAWWQAAMAYADTALMKNLQPWIVRKFAVPVVALYLYRLMATHRKLARTAPKRLMVPSSVSIVEEFDTKVEAMLLYLSQFQEFFASRSDCYEMLMAYAFQNRNLAAPHERYWAVKSFGNQRR